MSDSEFLMANQPLHFRFIWIPDLEHNSRDKNEKNRRKQESENAMRVFKKESSFHSDFKIANKLKDIEALLVEIEGYKPIFIFLGHGDQV